MTTDHLVIRADASTSTGIGHVMRSLALAQAWRDHGGDVVFALAAESPAIKTRLRSEGMKVARLLTKAGSADDAMQTVDLAGQLGARWVVTDGYHFDDVYQRIIRDSGLRLLLIDDNGSADHYSADMVLDQNIDAEEGRYANREPYTRLLLGTRYVLLRREFLKWRGWKRGTPQVARNVLVTIGGSDPNNVIPIVIQALRRIDVPGMQAAVLCGPGNLHNGELRTAVADLPYPVRLEYDVEDVAGLMKWAEVAITAGGITCWELAFMQVPALIVVTADNQWGAAHGLDSEGVFRLLGRDVDIGERELATGLVGLMRSAPLRGKMSAKGGQLVDGRGAERLLRILA